tara:strand:- start:388 stop:600 length:213 start_codon:yes stop_codon:yes gene_type:complete
MKLKVECEECGNDTEFIDLVDAAGILGIHPESLRRLHRYGDLDALKVERGLYFKRDSLNRYLETTTHGGE